MTRKRANTSKAPDSKIQKVSKNATTARIDIQLPQHSVDSHTRSILIFLFDWIDDWKDIIHVGMICREFYHLILNANNPTPNIPWKTMHAKLFGELYAPESVYPYLDPSDVNFSWKRHLLRCIASERNMYQGNAMKYEFSSAANHLKIIDHVSIWKNKFRYSNDPCKSWMFDLDSEHITVKATPGTVTHKGKSYCWNLEQQCEYFDLTTGEKTVLKNIPLQTTKKCMVKLVVEGDYLMINCRLATQSTLTSFFACHKISEDKCVLQVELPYFPTPGHIYKNTLYTATTKRLRSFDLITGKEGPSVTLNEEDPETSRTFITSKEAPHLIVLQPHQERTSLFLFDASTNKLRTFHSGDCNASATQMTGQYVALRLMGTFNPEYWFYDLKTLTHQMTLSHTSGSFGLAMKGCIAFLPSATAVHSNTTYSVDAWNLHTKQKLYSIPGNSVQLVLDATRLFISTGYNTKVVKDYKQINYGVMYDFFHTDLAQYRKYLEELQDEDSKQKMALQHLKDGKLKNATRGTLSLFEID